MPIFTDAHGLDFTAHSEAAAKAYDWMIDGYIRLSPETSERLKDTMKLDPFMVMANVMKGYFTMLMTKVELVEAGRRALKTAQAVAGDATPREQLHVQALDKWLNRDMGGAAQVWEQILLDHPRDLLAIRLAHYAHFYSGDPRRLRDSILRVMPYWDESVPHYSHLLGMKAFGYEESGMYADAERTGRQAIEMDPVDPWATHAVTHVLEMQDRHEDGLLWVDRLRPHWTEANNFQVHIWWHEALLRLDVRDPEEVLTFYDTSVNIPGSDESLDMCNFSALLQRLEIRGVDVGDRWQSVAERAAKHTHEGFLTFIDLHFGLALAAADHPGFHEMRAFLDSYEARTPEFNAVLMKEVCLPMLDAFKAYRDGAYGKARHLLFPLRYDWWRMGGSHAQRDLFEQILIDATIKAGDKKLARALMIERMANKPADPWTAMAFDSVMSWNGSALPHMPTGKVSLSAKQAAQNPAAVSYAQSW